MADKKIIVEREDLSSLSESIREKAGSNAESLVWPDGFIDVVENIETGVDASDVTANASNIQAGYRTFNASGALVEGTMPERTLATTNIINPTQTISVQSGHYTSDYTIGIPASARVNLDADHLLDSTQVLGITGSIPTQTPTNREITIANQTETISAGYYPSNFTISIPASATTGLDANKMLNTATILGVTGSIPTVTVSKNTLSSEEDSITVPAGYHASATNITIDTNNINDLNGNNIIDSAEILGVQGTIPTISPSKEELTTTTDYATIPLGYNPTVKTITIASSAVSDLNSNNILAGNTILGVSGSIPTQSISNPIISAVLQSIPIPSGYYAFDTAISIKSEDQAKLIPENIKSGITVLGVTGIIPPETIIPDSRFKELIERTLSTVTDSNITVVGSDAFGYLAPLTSVDFPECTLIKHGGFTWCTSLTSINFPKCTIIEDTAFNLCSSLTSVNFPKCTSIGSSAFNLCSSLTSANFPKCTTIETNAFNSCSSLISISFPECTTIGTNAFQYCKSLASISFPECTTIRISAFQYCKSLTSIDFPKCTSIGANAFYSCTSLTSMSFPECKMIGSYAFFYCTSLTSVNFPECTTIGSSAFGACSLLTSINFPKCTTIGDNTFSNCKSLTSIDFPKCTSIGSSAFYFCTSLTSMSFPECATIGTFAFNFCTSLTSIDFPECTTISTSAFYSCTSLTSVNFPKCTSIESYIFSKCTSLQTTYFPTLLYLNSISGFAGLSYLQNVTIYGRSTSTLFSSTFRSCYRLINLTVLRSEGVAPLVATTAFDSTPISTYTSYTNGIRGSIYVPASLVDAYKSATNWATYADRITAIPEE